MTATDGRQHTDWIDLGEEAAGRRFIVSMVALSGTSTSVKRYMDPETVTLSKSHKKRGEKRKEKQNTREKET